MIMKKIFYPILFLAILSCTPKVTVNDNIFNGTSMLRTMNGKYSMQQFDSMCIADTLPRDLSKWIKFNNRDYETSEEILFYSAYKKNCVYKVEDTKDDSVKITKRVTK